MKTQYDDCSQLDQQGRDANVAAGDPQCSQISGVRPDTAWKYSAGTPDVSVAILDTGIRWQDRELTDKVHLNRQELPLPRGRRHRLRRLRLQRRRRVQRRGLRQRSARVGERRRRHL